MRPSLYRLSLSERDQYREYAQLALPRHTSYPIAAVWNTDYRADQYREDLARPCREEEPLSLYVHIPFCEQLCYYCACNKEIIPASKRQLDDPVEGWLAGLALEVNHLIRWVEGRPVEQLHLGGGSPTYLSPGQLQRLFDLLEQHFVFFPGAERAIEIDPRIATREHLQVLRDPGFNRIGLGVQDFDPGVQQAVHRLQPFDMVRRCVEQVRELDFESINFDLIYGLPFQTIESMTDTLHKTLELAPDRIAFYRLAVIPEIFRWQNVFRPEDLPADDLPLELNLLAINTFLAAGYEFIGLDHFARSNEALTQARDVGRLRRNFQGMTTGKHLEIVGLGPSAISHLHSAFAQNEKSSAGWRQAVSRDFATERGWRLSLDDRLRQELLQQLYGHGSVDLEVLAAQFGVAYPEYFAREQSVLEILAVEGLIEYQDCIVRLTEPLGRLLVRVVAAVFDRYLPADAFYKGLPGSQASRVG